jgi:hypothetical protein
MIDLLLAVVVVGAVIAFGALISVGNERQRRAIDALHQAYKQWAIQDLQIKRGMVGSQTQIEDGAAWLTKAISLGLGQQTDVMDYQFHDIPMATIELHPVEFGNTVICTLESPQVLLPKLRKKVSGLRGELRVNPVFRIGKKTPAVELSMLNAGTMFDIELPVAWEKLTGQVTESDTLWVYILS